MILSDKLSYIPINELKQNRKYFFISTNEPNFRNNSQCDAFSGIFVGFHQNETMIEMYDLRNLITLKKTKRSWYFNINNVHMYEKIRQQELMEEKYLKIIIRKIIGDNSFTHYLFEGIDIDYELLSDDLVLDDKDYEIIEVFKPNKLTLNKYLYLKILQVLTLKCYIISSYKYLRWIFTNITFWSIFHTLLTMTNLFIILKVSNVKS